MTPWGFRALSGPFERLDQQQFTALGIGLVGVCALDVVAGVWLLQGRKRGASLGLATTVPALALGAGFALPFLLAGVPISSGPRSGRASIPSLRPSVAADLQPALPVIPKASRALPCSHAGASG